MLRASRQKDLRNDKETKYVDHPRKSSFGWRTSWVQFSGNLDFKYESTCDKPSKVKYVKCCELST
jgi:hypothetical protein